MLGLGNSITSGASLEGFVDLNSVSSLQLWLKNGTGVTAAQWDDSSGNARHATQGTAGDQADVSNGGLLFKASEADHYDFTAINIAKNQGFCAAWVMNLVSDGANSILSDGNNEVIAIQNANKIRLIANDDSAVDTGLFVSGEFGEADGKMLVLMNRTAAGVWSLYKDGSELTIAADGSGSSTNSSDGDNVMGFDVDTLGARNVMGGQYFDGELLELAFWNRALTDAEIANVNTYEVDIHSL